jgi:ribosomal protein S18 acetylase RimI-like enzyme
LETAEEKQAALLLIKENFHSRWFDDVKDAEPKEFVGLFDSQEIIGFVRISHPDFRKLANSTNLYPRYRCLGGIGPLGIVSKWRGCGLGEFMVRYAVGELFEMGCSDVIVDWTGLIGFYKKCGFGEISDEFVLYELQL